MMNSFALWVIGSVIIVCTADSLDLALFEQRVGFAGVAVEIAFTADQAVGELEGVLVVPIEHFSKNLALGFNKQRSLRHGDVGIFQISEQRDRYDARDSFIEDDATVRPDPVGYGNLRVLGMSANETHFGLRFVRPLVTCDTQNDEEIGLSNIWFTFVVGFQGEKLIPNQGSGSVLVSPILSSMEVKTLQTRKALKVGTFWASSLTSKQEVISFPASNATFQRIPDGVSFNFNLTETFDANLYLQSFEGVDRSSQVSHSELQLCSDGGCQTIAHWSPGVTTVRFPQGSGLRLGCPENVKCRGEFRMILHLNSLFAPDEFELDFEFLLHVETAPPSFEVGSFQISADSSLLGVEAKTSPVVAVECPSQCTKQLEKALRTFAVSFSTLSTGKSVRLRIVRGDRELAPIAEIENYDPQEQAIIYVNRRVLPNDRLILECGFKNKGDDRVHEKCVANLLHSSFNENSSTPNLCSSSSLNPVSVQCGLNFLENLEPEPRFEPAFTERCLIISRGAMGDPLEVYGVSIVFVVILLVLLGLMRLFRSLIQYSRFGSKFEAFSPSQKDCVLVYFVSLVGVTFMFVLLLFGISILRGDANGVFKAGPRGVFEQNSAVPIIGIVHLPIALMIFELACRPVTDLWLGVHHVLTIVIILSFVQAFYQTFNVVYASIGAILNFYLATEQPAYYALIRKRFGASHEAVFLEFMFAAVWSFVTKNCIFLGALITWGRGLLPSDADEDSANFWWLPGFKSWTSAFEVFAPVIILILFFVQQRLTYVLFLIAMKARRDSQRKLSAESHRDEQNERDELDVDSELRVENDKSLVDF